LFLMSLYSLVVAVHTRVYARRGRDTGIRGGFAVGEGGDSAAGDGDDCAVGDGSAVKSVSDLLLKRGAECAESGESVPATCDEH
jgi:hypothetical protein